MAKIKDGEYTTLIEAKKEAARLKTKKYKTKILKVIKYVVLRGKK